MENNNNITSILIEKIVEEKIHDKIDIELINNLFEIIGNNKPIPIEYYTKQLIELSDPNDKKCNFKICKRKALYTDSYNNYCWIHCQDYY